MPVTVSDASVIGALVFEEPAADTAEQLVGLTELHAPSLLTYELTNIARNKLRRGEKSREELIFALRRAFALDLHWHEVRPLVVFELAADTGLTAYDASYLYLAMTLGLPLATFDTQLRAAAEGRATVL